MKQLPKGKGLFIWQIKLCMGGDVQLIAQQAKALGLQWVAVKIHRGYSGYNYRLVNGQWVDDYVPALKDALVALGIELWGWGDVWLLDGKREADKIMERMEKFDLAGYLMDAEGQAKRSPDRNRQARILAAVLGMASFAVGLCSYRFPEYHPELPWNELLACCDFHAPQVYWINGKDPAGQLELSMSSLAVLKDVPFVPAGPLFYEHGWKPTPLEVQEFHAAVLETCGGVIYWEWVDVHDEGYAVLLQELEGWGDEQEPEPAEWRAWVESKIAEFEQRLDAGGL